MSQIQYDCRGLLLVMANPLRFSHGSFWIDQQACRQIEGWLDHFDSIVVAAPLLPDAWVKSIQHIQWQATTQVRLANRVQWVPMPWADDRPCRQAAREQLARLISRAYCLQFYVRSELGDLGTIAAQEAHRQRRTYLIHAVDEPWLPLPHTQSLEQVILEQGVDWLLGLYQRWLMRQCRSAWTARLNSPTPTIIDRLIDVTEYLLSQGIALGRSVQRLPALIYPAVIAPVLRAAQRQFQQGTAPSLASPPSSAAQVINHGRSGQSRG